jgi:hypothetical protein
MTYSSHDRRVGRRGAGLAVVLALSLGPSTAGAAVTHLSQGRGISLSPNPITSTGKISLALPLAITDPLSSTLFTLTNSSTGDAIDATGPVAVRAKVNGSGKYAVIATGGNSGAGLEAFGGPNSGQGVYAVGSGTSPGIYAVGGATGGAGVRGDGQGTNAYGVKGFGTGNAPGVGGQGGPAGPGVQGIGQGAGAGVIGTGGSSGDGVDGTSAGSGVFGVSGASTCSTCSNGIPLSSNTAGGHFTANAGYGVFGYSAGDNGGVFENNSDSWFALYAQADSAKGYPFEAENSQTGGYMYLDPNGNLFVSGTVTANGTVLTASDGGWPAPHGHIPSGPARGTVLDAAGEAAFDGNVTTDVRGFATVRLPGSFDLRYRNPRYQLTSVGQRGWDAKIGVWQPERNDRFVIRSSLPRVRISWRVTALTRTGR